MIKAQVKHIPDLGLRGGAGDENRTRTISLGICPVAQVRAAELGIQVPASDRDSPPFAAVNGTLMARWSCNDTPGAPGDSNRLLSPLH
jgi:hypothetical protein